MFLGFVPHFTQKFVFDSANTSLCNCDTLAEWLRRRPAKPLGSARVGSNPIGVVLFLNVLDLISLGVEIWFVHKRIDCPQIRCANINIILTTLNCSSHCSEPVRALEWDANNH